jgi:hypothetical protein
MGISYNSSLLLVCFMCLSLTCFYCHCNCEVKVTIIPFAMETCQDDPLRGALFFLVHLKTLRFIVNRFPSCLFPFIVNDIHIIGILSIVSSTNEYFPN